MSSRVGTRRSKNKLLTQMTAAAFLWFVIHWLGKGRHGKTSSVWNGSLLKSKHLGNQVSSTTHVCVNTVVIRIPVNYCFSKKKTKCLFPFNLHFILLQYIDFQTTYFFYISFSETERFFFCKFRIFWYNKIRLLNLEVIHSKLYTSWLINTCI